MFKNLLNRATWFSIKSIEKIIDVPLQTDLSIRVHNRLINFHRNDYCLEDSDICFVHIPKTAGTSIATTFDLLNKEGAAIGDSYKKHVPISNCCPVSKFKYVTSMRNPVDRVWSFYQMALRDKSNPYHRFTTRGIEYFILHCWECRNMMTKYLTGCTKDLKQDSELDMLALANLEKFYFIFDFESLDIFNKKFIEKVCKDRLLASEKLESIIASESFPNLRKFSYVSPTCAESDLIKKYNVLDLNLYQNSFRLVRKHLKPD